MPVKKKGGTIELQVENYKMAKHLHVVLVAGCNEIGGPNGAGKSSGLDAVSNIFAGKKLTPDEPVHEGAEAYKLRLKLTELGLDLMRVGTLQEDGSLKEEFIITEIEGPAAGRPIARPKELLDKLLGAHSVVLKPLLELSNADRIALLQRCAGLDFRELDAEHGAVYTERTTVNGETTAFRNRLEGMKHYPDAPEKLIVVADLIAERDRLQEGNASNYRARRDLEDTQQRVVVLDNEHQRLIAVAKNAAAQVSAAEGELKEAETAYGKESKAVDALTDINTDPISEDIAGAEEANAQIRANEARNQATISFYKSEKEGKKLTARLKEIDDKKKAQLAGAKIPGGLSWRDGQVRLKNKPLEQASQVEQMDVDIAVAIAQNPQIPIILVHEGSLYDKIHRAKLDKLGKKYGVYIMFERVIDTEEDAKREGVAVYMKDGVGINMKEESDADSK